MSKDELMKYSKSTLIDWILQDSFGPDRARLDAMERYNESTRIIARMKEIEMEQRAERDPVRYLELADEWDRVRAQLPA